MWVWVNSGRWWSVSIVNISSFISITTLSLFFTGPISTPAAFLSIRYYAVIIIHVAPQIKQQQSKHLWLQSPLTPGTLVGKDDLLLFWFSSGQSLSPVQLFATPCTAARQPSLSITNSQSLLLNSCQWCHSTISSSVVPLLWWVALKNVNKLTVLSFWFFYSGCLTSFRRLPSSIQGERCNKVYHLHWTSWVILHALLAYWL